VPHELASQPPFAAGASFNTGNCIALTSFVRLLEIAKAQVMPTALLCFILLIYMITGVDG
jgi:hypothetical protein